jgi:S1-C subfamily serine protease
VTDTPEDDPPGPPEATEPAPAGAADPARPGGGETVRKAEAFPALAPAEPAPAPAAAAAVDPADVGPPDSSDDGWPLEPSDLLTDDAEAPPAGPAPGELSPTASASFAAMPSPASAAYEAARIVGEMVGDINSAPGAALIAAAAAGAAIEAARARAAAGEPELPAVSAEDAASTDPAVTGRLERDRVLRALAEDIGGSADRATAARPAIDRPSQIRAALDRATQARPALDRVTQPRPAVVPPDAATDDTYEDDGELDPVAIAAAAIARLRDRARTDLAELRVQYHRHDGLVIVFAFAIIIATGWLYGRLVTPPTELFEPGRAHGLTLVRPQGWLSSPGDAYPAPRIAHELAPPTGKPSETLYRVELTSPIDPTARIEVLVDKKPAWSNIVTGLDLDRRTRWGELYTLDDSSVRSIEDHQWLRTAYRFAHAPEKGDVPRIDRAVEYATIDREQLYVLTFFGTPGEIARAEELVAPSLRVATQTGLPLVPQTGHLSTRKYPNAVAKAFESTVMVVVADVVDGRLHARGGGSGVIVGKDGSILTNFHVIHDQRGRLHDAFVIGRFSEQDKAPQLYCAGKPSRSKLARDLDLALLKCDLDLDGRTWSPATSAAGWATLPAARAADVKIGQRLWVLGYPDVGGGGLTLSEGEVEGWSGLDGRGAPPDRDPGAAGRDFIKTDAAIRHGNSGGPVVDDYGRLIGIASAVRTKQNAAGEVVEIVQAGGRVRPIAAASDLLAIAAAGWVPREGHTEVELQPSAVEVAVEGVQIQARVLDVVNEGPIRDALVMVLRPGITADRVDVNRLDDQVLAYGRSNAAGEVLLRQPVPVPGSYTLMVVAHGYEPTIGEGELILDARAAAIFDVGKLLLRAR